jgi:hypothetical protein
MSNKKPEISRSLEEMYKAVMKLGGPKGIFTQAIVDEYESAMKEEPKPELETKKIRISFLKKGKTNG